VNYLDGSFEAYMQPPEALEAPTAPKTMPLSQPTSMPQLPQLQIRSFKNPSPYVDAPPYGSNSPYLAPSIYKFAGLNY
jgi:hypothetical protein